MNPGWVTVVIVVTTGIFLTASVIAPHLGTRKSSRAELTARKEYQALADEFRRLSDMAITAQEHTDLRLTDVSVQLNDLREKLEQMQRILSDVE
jgi:p-aminobenzoyl-glutamate transporter AbgT